VDGGSCALVAVVRNGLVMCLLVLPQAALSFTARAKSVQIGVVQQRLMHRLGYSRIPEIGYMRGNTDTATPEFNVDGR
jgi:hypothetical protein